MLTPPGASMYERSQGDRDWSVQRAHNAARRPRIAAGWCRTALGTRGPRVIFWGMRGAGRSVGGRKPGSVSKPRGAVARRSAETAPGPGFRSKKGGHGPRLVGRWVAGSDRGQVGGAPVIHPVALTDLSPQARRSGPPSGCSTRVALDLGWERSRG